MTSLILDHNGMRVRSEGNALALYDGDGRRGTVPLALLDRVIMHGSGIALETGVLLRLAEQGIATLLLSGRASRRVASVYGAGHNNVAVRIAQAQAVADADFCLAWARGLVAAKVACSGKFLRSALDARPDARKALTDAEGTLAEIAHKLLGTPDIDSVRGFEGAAAAAHFRGFAALFVDGLGFTGRNRRPPRDPVNACLSLAYTLATADAARAAFSAGLDPMIGFYHRPAFGRESLACDLIEPLRPAIDAWVWGLFRDRCLRAESFQTDRGACLLGKAGHGKFYSEYERGAIAWQRWQRVACRSLGAGLESRAAPYLDADSPDDGTL